MTEIIYVLLVGYAGYVIYTAMSDESVTKKSEKPSAAAFTAPPPLMPNIESKLLVKPETISKVEKTDDQSSKTTTAKKGLKNPKTGEVVSSYANYRVMNMLLHGHLDLIPHHLAFFSQTIDHQTCCCMCLLEVGLLGDNLGWQDNNICHQYAGLPHMDFRHMDS